MRPSIFIVFIALLCFNQQVRSQDSTDTHKSNTVGIALAATGLGLSTVSLANPVIGLSGMLNDNRGQQVYGLYIGPGINVCGSLLSYIALCQLNNKVNSTGAINEVFMKKETVRTLSTLSIVTSAVSILGSVLFYKLDMANEMTYTLAIPVSFLSDVIGIISGAKSLRQNIKNRNGIKPTT